MAKPQNSNTSWFEWLTMVKTIKLLLVDTRDIFFKIMTLRNLAFWSPIRLTRWKWNSFKLSKLKESSFGPGANQCYSPLLLELIKSPLLELMETLCTQKCAWIPPKILQGDCVPIFSLPSSIRTIQLFPSELGSLVLWTTQPMAFIVLRALGRKNHLHVTLSLSPKELGFLLETTLL